jgi:multiple sugar transport system permease protein
MEQPVTRREWHNLRDGLLYVSPWLIGLTVFMVLPAGMAFYFSLCSYSVLNAPVYVGAANYTFLAHDQVFLKSVWNTLAFAAISLPLGLLLSLSLALLLNADVRGRAFFRAIFFFPSLVPLVALAILWSWIFNGQYGVLNYFLHWFGIKGPDWLGDVAWAKPAIAITGFWGIGNSIVIYLAGLQDVPRSLYEAATIDGAGWWQKTRHVTLPMISPVIYFNMLMGCIGVLQIFVVPYVMTGGGPARATLFYTMYLFDTAFTYLRMGYACAMAWVLFLMIALLTYTAHRLMRKHVHYGI